MKVTILQLNSIWENPDENINRAENLMAQHQTVTCMSYQRCGVQVLLQNLLVLQKKNQIVRHYYG